MHRKKGGKSKKKGKKTGGKAKKTYLFYFLIFIFYFNTPTTSSRKTWADRQDEDDIENAKGTPTRLQPYVL